MIRSDFEDILILSTPYYQNLERTYRDVVGFNRYIDILKKMAKGDGFIEKLEKKKGKELVFLGRKIFSLQEEFISNYLNFISNESHVDKWEEFFERYSKNLFEIYEKFVMADSSKILIFEIVNRKLLRDLLTKHTMEKSLEQKAHIAERFGAVVNQLFNYIRNSLTKNTIVKDNLIAGSYEKLPLLPRCTHSEMMKLLAKRIFQKGIPEPLFTAIAKALITNYYVETKAKIIAELKQQSSFTRDVLVEVFKSHFFFPDDETLSEIHNLIKSRAEDMIKKVQKKKEQVDTKIFDIKRKTKDKTDAIHERLIALAEDFSTEEAVDSMIKKLRRTLVTDGYDLRILKNKLQHYTKKESELNSVLQFKIADLHKFILKNEWDPYIILSINAHKAMPDEHMQAIVKEAASELRDDKYAMDRLNAYRITGFLKERFDTEKIMNEFDKVVGEIIQPLVQSLLLEEMIEYYPRQSGWSAGEAVRYIAEEAVAGRVNMVEKAIPGVKNEKEIPQFNILRYKNLVTILTYDIRGSTFMGTKLRDAKRESEIRAYFQETMLSIVEKYGGVPIKDTGDGGIVLFASNYYDIKEEKTVELEPGSALSAVRSGLEMVQGAKNFVQENIKKYKDWFRESEERTVSFEGGTYATLPPSYQAIFQIGIGLASGMYPSEIYLEKNAFGKLDLTGMLVREANFYSKVRAKEKSTVICDDATVYNLLLNVNKFSFLSEKGLRIDPLLLDIEQGLEYWINQKITRRGFILDLYKIFVTQLGQEVTHPGSLKIMLGMLDIAIDETGEIKDGKGGRGKFLFELSSEGVK
jgi:hypothetical protein